MPSLIEKWHPVTHDFGLIKAPIEPVLAEFLNWHGSLGIKYERTEIASSLADALASLLPLAASQMRRLSSPQAQTGSPVSKTAFRALTHSLQCPIWPCGWVFLPCVSVASRIVRSTRQQSGKCMHLSLLAVARLATVAPSALPTMMMAGSFTSEASAIHSSRSSVMLSDASATTSPVICCA